MSKKSRASHMPLIFAAAAVILAVSALWQFILAPRLTHAETAVSSVRFSEVMTANSSAVADDYGAYSDWFEVENTGEATKLILAQPTLFTDYEITKGNMDDVFLAATGKKLHGGAEV